MLGGLLAIAPGAKAQSCQPTLEPPGGQWATDGSDVLTFGGCIDPGPTSFEGAILKLDKDGNQIANDENGFPLGKGDTSDLAVDEDGTVSGSGFAGKTTADDDPVPTRYLQLQITATYEEGTKVFVSERLAIDRVRPTLLRYELFAPDVIRVVFSEVVVYFGPSVTSGTPGNPADWVIEGGSAFVTEVTGSGEERFLRLNKKYGEDDITTVRFLPNTQLGVEKGYRDGAGKKVTGDQSARSTIDRIAPVVPVIASMDGKPTSTVTSNKTTAVVVVNGLTKGKGHSAELFKESDGNTSFTPGDTSIAGPALESDGSVSFTINPTEGTNRLYAVAYDPSGNRSGAKNGVFVLDTVAPKALGPAEVIDGNFIRVRFDEGVYGLNSTSNWKVGNGAYPVEGVFGDGTSRLIQVRGVPAGTAITYTAPTSGGYVDAAGNRLATSSYNTDKTQPSPGPSPTPPAPSPSPSNSPAPTPTPTPSGSPSPTPTPTPSPDEGDKQMSAVTELSSATAGSCQNVIVRLTEENEAVAGENVDAMLDDPELSFCGSGSGHDEAFTDDSGEAVFGVRSSEGGSLDVIVWHDPDDDDKVDTGESGQRVTVTWRTDGRRRITLSTHRRVLRGKKIALRGSIIAASSTCASSQIVQIVRKRGDGRVVASARSAADGTYIAKVRISRAGRYFARLGGYGGCDAVRSRAVRIRVRS